MNVLERKKLNPEVSEFHSLRIFLWDLEELTFLNNPIKKSVKVGIFAQNFRIEWIFD